VADSLGNITWSSTRLLSYAKWLEQQQPNITAPLINATEGGVLRLRKNESLASALRKFIPREDMNIWPIRTEVVRDRSLLTAWLDSTESTLADISGKSEADIKPEQIGVFTMMHFLFREEIDSADGFRAAREWMTNLIAEVRSRMISEPIAVNQ
jgi:hypothetical protein